MTVKWSDRVGICESHMRSEAKFAWTSTTGGPEPCRSTYSVAPVPTVTDPARLQDLSLGRPTEGPCEVSHARLQPASFRRVRVHLLMEAFEVQKPVQGTSGAYATVNLLGTYPDATRLVLYLDGLGRVDVTGAMTLRQLAEEAMAAGISVEIRDVPSQASRIVRRVVGDVVPVRLIDAPHGEKNGFGTR